MNRHHFIKASGTLIVGTALGKTTAPHFQKDEPLRYKIPPYLKAGDTIGITSPAGYITAEEIQPAVMLMQSWGFNIKIGMAIGKRLFTFGGTDEERLQDFQTMLDDDSVKAIMCARGGYGAIRIVDRLNWERFRQKPKWIIGFSDITVLHSHIHHNLKTASLHSKMCNSFPDNWGTAEPVQTETIRSIKNALTGEPMQYKAVPNLHNKLGSADGILIGGNLKTIESLSGTASDIDTREKILLVEDTGEYLYSIDRMFWNLKRTGKLSHLKGLVIGGFKIKPDDAGEEFGKTIEEIVLEKTGEYSYPVGFDFPVGHQKANFAFKFGVAHQLHITAQEAALTQTV